MRSRLSRLAFVLRRRRHDDEAQHELAGHLELLIERYVRQGMSDGEARAAAKRQLGNTSFVREDIRQLNTLGWLESLVRDLRFAARQGARDPIFALVVIGTRDSPPALRPPSSAPRRQY